MYVIGRRVSRVALTGLLPLAILAGCPDAPASPTAAPQPAPDAGPPKPPPPPFDTTDDALDLVSVAVESGGTAQPLDPRATPLLVPPALVLRLETWQRLADFRVRLVASDDRLVPTEVRTGPVLTRGRTLPRPGGTWVRLEPSDPLDPLMEYRLKIEGEVDPEVRDDAGRTYADLVLELRARPEPAPAAADGGTPDGAP